MSFEIKLHPKQKEIFLDPNRFRLLVCGRRFGKSHLLRTQLIVNALTYDQPIDPNFPPTIALIMPTLKQCKAVHWKALVGMLKDAPFVKNINHSDYRITFKGGKPDIVLRGTNDDCGDGLRGLKFYFVAADEFQDIKPDVWEQVVFPALGDTPGSTATLCATPKGKNHSLYKFYLKIKELAEWSYYHFTTKDNPHFPLKQLRQAKAQMPEKSYKQEYQASFENFSGQLFDQLSEKHYIKDIPDTLSFYCGSDWGDRNPSIVIVGLSQDRSKFYIVDFWLNRSGETIPEEIFLKEMARLCTKYNVYRCYLPDDRGGSVKSARILGKRENIPGMSRAVEVSRTKLGLMPSIDIMNNLFYQDNLFIKANLVELISQFEDYHRATDSEGELVNKPADHQEDHTIDAARYCIGSLYNALQNKQLRD
ncbi:terminase family protein [Nostoc sp. UIC 10630]|uniref:terminase large subunit domain-containing protein n=1 Tax=Nostoc sp. UIC 10630 TaxID=2100146 RepID=UPI0013D4FDD0|nr:terminase family protein [Nostoc sp. UIC 10630]NEU81487.1 hypothetical protein [Nostoc sp. UIC 10630]